MATLPAPSSRPGREPRLSLSSGCNLEPQPTRQHVPHYKCGMMREDQVGFSSLTGCNEHPPYEVSEGHVGILNFHPTTKGNEVSLPIQSSGESGLSPPSSRNIDSTCVVSMEATWKAEKRHPSCPNQGGINRGLAGSLNFHAYPRSTLSPFSNPIPECQQRLSGELGLPHPPERLRKDTHFPSSVI